MKPKKKVETIVCKELLIGSPEWHYAWGFLAGHTGDEDREAYNKVWNESWQYTCSFMREGRYWHEFRHRAHPVDDERWIVQVPAREDWQPGTFKPQAWLEECARGMLYAEELTRDLEERSARVLGKAGVTLRGVDGDVPGTVEH